MSVAVQTRFLTVPVRGVRPRKRNLQHLAAQGAADLRQATRGSWLATARLTSGQLVLAYAI